MKKIFFLILFLIVTNSCAQEKINVIVSWDPVQCEDLMGYKIYWGFHPRVYGNFIDVHFDTSYTMIDIAQDSIYYFAITSYDTCMNESNFSDEVTTYGLDFIPPPVPGGIHIEAEKIEQIIIIK